MDLIDRAALFKSMNILFDKEHFQNWSNTAWQIVQDQPTIESVPLDKLCELLADMGSGKNNTLCIECCGSEGAECPDENCLCQSSDAWKRHLIKWMEGLDAPY